MYKIIKLLYSYLPESFIIFLGKSKLLQSIRNSILRPSRKDVIVKEKVKWGIGEFYFYAPIKVAIKAKRLGIENTLLRNSIKLINRIQKPEYTVLDIGANYGFISLALQSNIEKDLKIIAFEPHPEICEVFKKSIDENRIANIQIENVAVGNEAKEVVLNLYDQTSNILETGHQSLKTISVQQISMDDYISSNQLVPDFIKIDVDGFELKILQGLKETILKHKPNMVVETNNDPEILNFFSSLNYQLYDLRMNSFTEIPNNIFCIPLYS